MNTLMQPMIDSAVKMSLEVWRLQHEIQEQALLRQIAVLEAQVAALSGANRSA